MLSRTVWTTTSASILVRPFVLATSAHQVGFGHLSSFVSASITDRFYTEDLKKGERKTRVLGMSAAGIPGFSQILHHYRDRSPLGRTVDAEEVAETARFLLGPAGRGVTGEVLMVDGGFHSTGM